MAICFASMTQAQLKINVQNGAKTAFYDDFEEAIQQAVSGDTIYLPGRVIPVSSQSVVINKKLAIIGAGWDTDSIGGLQTTEIKYGNNYADINFQNGSDGSLITGCYVHDINFGTNDAVLHNISNVTIWRNRIGQYITLGYNRPGNQVNQIFIFENLIYSDIISSYASDCIVNNNLCRSLIGLWNTRISNNVLRGFVQNLHECVVENNYIISQSSSGNDLSGCSNSTFLNNAFQGTLTFPVRDNSGSNNLMGQAAANTFVLNDLIWPKNLEILASSPCKNAGTDGTDIGIYGGPVPYKAGAVPFNPHIDEALISSQTDSNGKLKVSITVTAQER